MIAGKKHGIRWESPGFVPTKLFFPKILCNFTIEIIRYETLSFRKAKKIAQFKNSRYPF
jgi:hypothetical protein